MRARRCSRESVGVGTGLDCGKVATSVSTRPSPDCSGALGIGLLIGPPPPGVPSSTLRWSMLARPPPLVAAMRMVLAPAGRVAEAVWAVQVLQPPVRGKASVEWLVPLMVRAPGRLELVPLA